MMQLGKKKMASSIITSSNVITSWSQLNYKWHLSLDMSIVRLSFEPKNGNDKVIFVHGHDIVLGNFKA